MTTLEDWSIAVKAITKGSAEQKAAFYNVMLEKGTDAQIRAAVEKVLGKQTDEAWSYLQALAAEQRKPPVYVDINDVEPAGRTAALLVPNTAEGKFYNAIPDVIRKIAESVDSQLNVNNQQIEKRVIPGEKGYYEGDPDTGQYFVPGTPDVIKYYNRITGNEIKPLFDISGAQFFGGSKEKLEQVLTEAIGQFSFDQVKSIGFQNFANYIQKLPIFPPPDLGEIIDFSPSKTALEVQSRKLPNGYYSFPAATAYALMGWCFDDKGTRVYLDQLPNPPKIFYDYQYGICFAEEVAYWMTGNPPLGLFGLDAVTKLAGQISQVLNRNSSGGAWGYFGATEMLRRIAQRWLGATGVSDLNDLEFRKENITVSYNFESYYDEVSGVHFYQILTEDGWVSLDQSQITNADIKILGTERRYDTESYVYVLIKTGVFNTTQTQEGIYDKKSNRYIVTSEQKGWFSKSFGTDRLYIDLGGWGEGEGVTYASAYWYPGASSFTFETWGKATGLKAFLSSDLFKIVSIGLAVWGIGAALASISTTGIGIANVAQLTASVNNLPGVDLGIVGDIAAGISGGIKLASSIPGAFAEGFDAFDASALDASGLDIKETIMDFEFSDFNFDAVDVPVFDTGGFDMTGLDFGDIPVIDPGLVDIDLTLADIGANVVDIDESIFADYGLELGDLIPDEFGNIFTVTGDAVTLTPEAYVKSIYIDESGNYRDYTNNILLSQQEAELEFNESGADNDAVFAKLAEKAQAIAGNSFIAQEGPQARPAGTPQPAAQGEVPFFKVLSQEVMGWFKTITSYSLAKEQLDKTGRYTPPYQTNPSGTAYSQVPGVPVRRADGSTVTNNGNGTQTIQFADGRVQTLPTNVNPNSFSGGQLIAGVSNQTLLLAGAGLLAVLLLARRK